MLSGTFSHHRRALPASPQVAKASKRSILAIAWRNHGADILFDALSLVRGKLTPISMAADVRAQRWRLAAPAPAPARNVSIGRTRASMLVQAQAWALARAWVRAPAHVAGWTRSTVLGHVGGGSKASPHERAPCTRRPERHRASRRWNRRSAPYPYSAECASSRRCAAISSRNARP